MRNWTFEFLRESESRDNKIARVNTIHITPNLSFFLFRTGVWVRCNDILKLTIRAQSIYREVYVYRH